MILAEVVSTVASAPFGQYAADELLRPAGMSASAFLDVGGVRPIPGWSSGERVDLTFTSVGDGGLIDLDAAFIAMTNTDERGATAFSAGLRHLVDSVLADHLDPDADPWTVTHGRTTS